MKTDDGYAENDEDYIESDYSDEDDYFDYYDEFQPQGLGGNVVVNAARTNPNQQAATTNAGGGKQLKSFQPSEKVFTKFVNKINVDKYTGPVGSVMNSQSRRQDTQRTRTSDVSDRATVEQVMDPRTRNLLKRIIAFLLVEHL